MFGPYGHFPIKNCQIIDKCEGGSRTREPLRETILSQYFHMAQDTFNFQDLKADWKMNSNYENMPTANWIGKRASIP